MLRLIACYLLGSVLFFVLWTCFFACPELSAILLYAYACVTFTFFCAQCEVPDKKNLRLWAVLVPLTPLWVMWMVGWITNLCDWSL